MKRASPGHGTTARYTQGCRCDDCRRARNAYQREYYRTHPRGTRDARSYWSAEERTLRHEERDRRWEALSAAEPCIRCELRGSGYPLCTVCAAELRDERVGAGIGNTTYILNAIPLLVEVIKNGYKDYDNKEHRWMMEDVRREAERFRAAIHGGLECDRLEAWRSSFIGFLGAILDVLPVR